GRPDGRLQQCRAGRHGIAEVDRLAAREQDRLAGPGAHRGATVAADRLDAALHDDQGGLLHPDAHDLQCARLQDVRGRADPRPGVNRARRGDVAAGVVVVDAIGAVGGAGVSHARSLGAGLPARGAGPIGFGADPIRPIAGMVCSVRSCASHSGRC
ncbi:MAG: hypothetical protein EOO24_27530, partial [Comamonadaceae bacterium]